MFGTLVKTLFGMPAFHIKYLYSVSSTLSSLDSSTFDSAFCKCAPWKATGGMAQVFGFLHHTVYDSGLHISSGSSPICCRYMEREPAHSRSLSVLSTVQVK